jgi:hypothetical protein
VKFSLCLTDETLLHEGVVVSVYVGSLCMPSSGMLRRVAFVGTDASEECDASIIRVT